MTTSSSSDPLWKTVSWRTGHQQQQHYPTFLYNVFEQLIYIIFFVFVFDFFLPQASSSFAARRWKLATAVSHPPPPVNQPASNHTNQLCWLFLRCWWKLVCIWCGGGWLPSSFPTPSLSLFVLFSAFDRFFFLCSLSSFSPLRARAACVMYMCEFVFTPSSWSPPSSYPPISLLCAMVEGVVTFKQNVLFTFLLPKRCCA